MKLKGAPYAADPIIGPVGFIETRLRIGPTEYCGRFAQLRPGEIRRRIWRTASRSKVPPQPVRGRAATRSSRPASSATTATRSTATAATRTAPPPPAATASMTAGEACDDGNAVDGDGCDANCTLHRLRQRHPDRRRGVRRRQPRRRRRLRRTARSTACGNGIQSRPARRATTATWSTATAATRTAPSTACGNGIQTAGEGVRRRQRDRAATAAAPNCTRRALRQRHPRPQEQCDDGNVDGRRRLLASAPARSEPARRQPVHR